jgi:hypothetical protein
MIFFSLNRYGIVGGEQTVLALDINADKVLWNHLSYRAKSLFGKVITDVHLRAVSAAEAADLLISDPAGEALQPSGATILSLLVDAKIYPWLGSDEILKTQSWFDPNDAAALQRVRQRQGEEKWQKRYRFTNRGVWRLKKKPNDSREANLPLDGWTKIRSHFYYYRDKGSACCRILEPSSLLYFASAIDFTKCQTPLSLCVFNKKQLHLVKVSVSRIQDLRVSYLEKRENRQLQVNKKIDAIKISIQPRALAREGQEPEVFSFLGLKGDFDIFIDKTTQLPVQISGKVSTFGKLDFKLQAVSLAGIGVPFNDALPDCPVLKGASRIFP